MRYSVVTEYGFQEQPIPISAMLTSAYFTPSIIVPGPAALHRLGHCGTLVRRNVNPYGITSIVCGLPSLPTHAARSVASSSHVIAPLHQLTFSHHNPRSDIESLSFRALPICAATKQHSFWVAGPASLYDTVCRSNPFEASLRVAIQHNGTPPTPAVIELQHILVEFISHHGQPGSWT